MTESERLVLENDFKELDSQYDFSFLFGKSIFITGATGLVARYLIFYLLHLNKVKNAKIKIVAFVRNKEKAEKIFGDAEKDIEFLCGDILDFENCVKSFGQNIDYIIHAASVVQSRAFVEKPVEVIDVAVNGTLKVLQFAVQKKVKSVLYLSSMEVYGVTDPAMKEVGEKDLGYIDLGSVRSSYSEAKRMCEVLCTSFASEYDLNVKVARLAQTLSPLIDSNDNRVTAMFARCVRDEKDIVLKTQGKTKRPIIYIEDVVSGMLVILEKGQKGEPYTVANAETFMSVRDMAELVAREVAGGKIKVICGCDTPAEYAENINVSLPLAVKKLESLGWRASASVKESYEKIARGGVICYPPDYYLPLAVTKLESLGWRASVGATSAFERMVGAIEGK